MMEGPQEGELPLQPLTHTLDAAATPAVPDPALADPLPPEPNPAPALPAAPDASHGATSAPQTIPAVPSATEPQVNANALPAADTQATHSPKLGPGVLCTGEDSSLSPGLWPGTPAPSPSQSWQTARTPVPVRAFGPGLRSPVPSSPSTKPGLQSPVHPSLSEFG